MAGNTKVALTLSNSIIGVSILAMPFCMKQCGVILGSVILVSSMLLTRFTCHLLVKSSLICRRKTFELVALQTFGPIGKLVAELNIIGFMLGILISFFVVIGDLGPAIISDALGIQNSDALRTFLLLFVGLVIALPFSMLKEVDSLSRISTLSILFYTTLSLKTALEALPVLLLGEWTYDINWWQPAGILHSLPIFALSLSCQTQIFEIYDALPDPSLKHLNSVVKVAVYICTSLYFLVGFFGYVANYNRKFSGNILMSYSPGFITETIKLMFLLSVALSFPLIVLPCRTSIHSLLYKRTGGPFDASGKCIPSEQFKLITTLIVVSTLFVGLLCPNIEMVLGFIGSTIGILICIIFPALLFIQLTSKYTFERWGAQLVLVTGVLLLASCTWVSLDLSVKADEPNWQALNEQNYLIPTKAGDQSRNEKGFSDMAVINRRKDGGQETKTTEKAKYVAPSSATKPPLIDAVKEPAESQADEYKRQEPPVPQEPEENIVKESLPEPAQDQVKSGEVKNMKVRADEIMKTYEQPEGKHASQLNTNDANEQLSLSKQEEILRKLEEQQEQQKQILEEQRHILEELKAHGKSHDDVDKFSEPLGFNNQEAKRRELLQQSKAKSASSVATVSNAEKTLGWNVSRKERIDDKVLVQPVPDMVQGGRMISDVVHGGQEVIALAPRLAVVPNGARNDEHNVRSVRNRVEKMAQFAAELRQQNRTPHVTNISDDDSVKPLLRQDGGNVVAMELRETPNQRPVQSVSENQVVTQISEILSHTEKPDVVANLLENNISDGTKVSNERRKEKRENVDRIVSQNTDAIQLDLTNVDPKREKEFDGKIVGRDLKQS